ncbi:MAG: carbohydrate kinase, partial [Christensenellaceae bacterium]|nr:carbohydrate kinase [Christensenellaceae bacterium]
AQCCDVSFDFSDCYTLDYVKEVCPHVRYAFFSGSHLSDEQLQELIATAHAAGSEIVGVTLGSKGSLFSKNGVQYREGIRESQVVDTMGAGDAFISGFLTHYTKNGDMAAAMSFAADRAAEVCGYYGGIGYPAPLLGYELD